MLLFLVLQLRFSTSSTQHLFISVLQAVQSSTRTLTLICSHGHIFVHENKNIPYEVGGIRTSNTSAIILHRLILIY